MGGLVLFLGGFPVPYVRRTKRRPSISRRLMIVVIACAITALVMAGVGMYMKQQERIASAAAEAATFTPAPLPEIVDPFRIAVVGDSFTGGSDMGGYRDENWVPKAADLLSTEELEVAGNATGIGGSGYVNRGPNGKVFGEVIGETFNERSDIVLFFGSINDLSHPVKEIGTAAAEAFATTKAAYPDATLVVAGPAWMRDDVPDKLHEINAELRVQAEAVDAVWIDPLAEEWFFDNPELIGEDGTHPTAEGHSYMAEKFIPHLEPLLGS